MRTWTSERLAWALIGLLVAFWLWFGIASAVEERLGWSNAILHVLVPGGAFALMGAVAWRWRRVGGMLLVAAGVTIMVGYPLVDGEFYTTSTLVFVLLATAAPAIAAGVLLLESRRPVSR